MPFRTRSSRTVSWMARLAKNWTVTSSGCLSRQAWTSSSSGSMGPGISFPVFRLTRAMYRDGELSGISWVRDTLRRTERRTADTGVALADLGFWTRFACFTVSCLNQLAVFSLKRLQGCSRLTAGVRITAVTGSLQERVYAFWRVVAELS